MISRDGTFPGMAPAALLFSDGMNDNALPTNDDNWLDGIRWMMTNSTRVINASANLGDVAAENSKSSLGTDWLITQARADGGDFLFVKSAGNRGTNTVSEPGLFYNGLTVGAVTNEDYQAGTRANQGPVDRRWNVVANYSQYGGSANVSKPEIVAPGSRVDTDTAEVGFVMAHNAPANSYSSNAGAAFVGTSYAAPHVAGIAAQLYQQAPNTNHRLMKAVLMNSADKTVRGCQHETPPRPHGIFYRELDPAWAAGNHGLDQYSGAGMIDAWAATGNLLAAGGQMGTGTGSLAHDAADPADVATIDVDVDTRIVATVVWDRQVTRTPPGGGNPITDETFAPDANQPHFQIAYAGGESFTQNTAGGSVQHINKIVSTPGEYKIQVKNNGAVAGDYAVAWAVSPKDV
ncbi:MAG: S8 family peptidase, partial [Tepidisphaeraceae bacterium]